MKWQILFLIAVLAMLQYRLWIGSGSVTEIVQLQKQIEAQQEENNQLRERNQLLSVEIESLKNHPDSIEQRARHDMGMIKQGETFVLIVDE